jgi:DNA-binding NarL/FixJ family response regulator
MGPIPSKISCLVVDESIGELAKLAGALKSVGAVAVHQATDKQDALKILNSHKIDIAFISNSQQRENGLDLVRKIRSAKGLPSRGLSIVMTSFASDAATITSAIRSGVDGFLRKPITLESLEKQLRAILSKPLSRVEFGDYFGPDRRRKVDRNFEGADRRSAEAVSP